MWRLRAPSTAWPAGPATDWLLSFALTDSHGTIRQQSPSAAWNGAREASVSICTFGRSTDREETLL